MEASDIGECGFYLYCKAPKTIRHSWKACAEWNNTSKCIKATFSPHTPPLFPSTLPQQWLLFIQVEGVVLFILLDVPEEGFPLLAQAGDHFLVDVGEQQLRVGLQAPLGSLESLHYGFARLFPPAALVILAPPAARRHVVPQPWDGVILLVPVVHLVYRAVGRAVITCAVVPDSEGSPQLRFRFTLFYIWK